MVSYRSLSDNMCYIFFKLDFFRSMLFIKFYISSFYILDLSSTKLIIINDSITTEFANRLLEKAHVFRSDRISICSYYIDNYIIINFSFIWLFQPFQKHYDVYIHFYDSKVIHAKLNY